MENNQPLAEKTETFASIINNDEKFSQRTAAKIHCCVCGLEILANPSKMCINCIKAEVDICENIEKEQQIEWCKGCDRYLNPPSYWINLHRESPELLGMCLKKIRGLPKVKLVDAGWIWTEPHSKRLKIKLTIESEVFNVILRDMCVVEFVEKNKFCPECHASEADNTWMAVVQLRQKAPHKRTLFYLEQMIIKHKQQKNVSSLEEVPNGLDFFFGSKNFASKFVDFLARTIPIKIKISERLTTGVMKYSYSVEVVPLCKDDLTCIPASIFHTMSLKTPFVLIKSVQTMIKLVDPSTGEVCEMSAQTFFKQSNFVALKNAKQFVEFVVLDVIRDDYNFGKNKNKNKNQKKWMEVEIVKMTDFGINDNTYFIKTHLLYLKEGDTVLGYDLSSAMIHNIHYEQMVNKKPDLALEIILVRKKQEKIVKKKIKTLNSFLHSKNQTNEDYQLFLEDVEQDKDLQTALNTSDVENIDPEGEIELYLPEENTKEIEQEQAAKSD